jgi:Na+-driven multidrug efflux pump
MLYVNIIGFGNIFIMFLNGVGKIRPQMIFNIFSVILFIPFSYLFAVKLEMGVAGIILSSIICGLFGPAIAPFQVRKVLRELEQEKGLPVVNEKAKLEVGDVVKEVNVPLPTADTKMNIK